MARAPDIDIWLAFHEEISDPRLLSRYRELMSEDERRRESGFRFDRDRKCHVVTRALVRTVLSRYAAIAPADWAFSANAYGRPRIANHHEDAEGLDFNVSHTRGLIAMAVSRHRELGIDVENVGTPHASPDLADQILSREELEAFSGVPEDRRQRRFLEYWTLKESYIKARGQGLSIPLDGFSVGHLHPCRERMRVDPALDDDAGRWAFWQFDVARDHLLALCAARSGTRSPTVAILKTVPMVADEHVEVVMLECLTSH